MTAIVLAATILVAGCDRTGASASGSASAAVFTDAMRNSPGFRLAQRYCTQCHAAPDPQAHGADEWPSVVARMLEHMRRLDKSVPDLGQTGTITDYLQQFAKKQ